MFGYIKKSKVKDAIQLRIEAVDGWGTSLGLTREKLNFTKANLKGLKRDLEL